MSPTLKQCFPASPSPPASAKCSPRCHKILRNSRRDSTASTSRNSRYTHSPRLLQSRRSLTPDTRHLTPSMRSIAIINQKGGVGKTTTAVNLSAALARAGQRVGLVDIDPQAHASLHLGLDPRSSVPTMYDLLTEETRIADLWQRAGAASPEESSLWVAASHIDLAAVEVELAGVVGREVILRDKI